MNFDDMSDADFFKLESKYQATLADPRREAIAQAQLNPTDTDFEQYAADPSAFEQETELQRSGFQTEYEKQMAEEYERVTAANAFEFLRRNPRFKQTPENGHNMETWVKQHGLPPTIESIQAAYEALAPTGILELTPEPITAPNLPYTERDLDNLSLAELEDIANAEAARNAIVTRPRR